MLAHLLKYDSSQGNYVAQGHTVDFHEGEGEDNYIVVDGKKIVIYKMPNAADLPWGKLGVDVVLECTGFYTSKEKASAHIQAGARKVVISAPAGNDLPTIVYNVNHDTLTAKIQLFLLHLAQLTALLLWLRLLTISLLSRVVSCAQSTLTQAIR